MQGRGQSLKYHAEHKLNYFFVLKALDLERVPDVRFYLSNPK